MDWGLVLTVPFLTALIGVLAATVTDIKSHEVPDWLSYALIALGILFNLAHTIVYKDFAIAYSLTGLAAGYAVGAALYYSGQWGGGDAKLLMGLGAVWTLPWAWFMPAVQKIGMLQFTGIAFPFFISFLGYLFVCGAVYGIAWMFYLIIKNWKKFKPLFVKEMRTTYKVWRVIALTITTALVLGSAWLLIQHNRIGASLTLLLAVLLFGSLYLVVSVRIAESEFMLKTVKAKQLTEGDWVVGGVKIGKEWIIPENNIGATKEQITILTKKAPNKEVIVKEGIPFVPSFLAAIIVAAL